MTYAIVVHGGAGFHAHEDDPRVKAALNRACSEAIKVLQHPDGTALDAVEVAIRILEDDGAFNAGYGSNLTLDGKVECDASLMEGRSQSFGAVGAVSGVKNPITAARIVLERGKQRGPLGRVPPLLLVGEGAREYCLEWSSGDPTRPCPSQIELVDPTELISSASRQEWETWMSRLRVQEGSSQTPIEGEPTKRRLNDTVGAVAIDTRGSIASGVSSGGLLLKHRGRIGEAAIHGSGSWAISPLGTASGIGCSISGTGEQIIQTALARDLCDRANPNHCEDTVGGIERSFERFSESCRAREEKGSAGAIVIISEPGDHSASRCHFYCLFTTSSMAVGYASSGTPNPKAKVHRREGGGRNSGGSHLFMTASTLF